MNNEVQIIGGGLYGCLTAYHIATNNPDKKVQLIEGNDHLISAFDPIELDDTFLNNGFHGLEIPRSAEFNQFISEVLKTPFDIRKNFRGLYVKGNLIDYSAPLKDWPEDLKPLFKKEVPFEFDHSLPIEDLITDELVDYLKIVGRRYSDDFANVRGLFVPWFFPADYYLTTKDEGDVFRNDVRSGRVDAKYAHPQNELFSSLQKPMEELLKSVGVDIQFNTLVRFGEKELIFEDAKTKERKNLNGKDCQRFFCASLVLILKDINPQKYFGFAEFKRSLYNVILESDVDIESKYSEILSADTNFPNVGRISFPNSNKKQIQVELFVINDDEIEAIVEPLGQNIETILNLKAGSVRVKEYKRTRVVFFPPAEMQKATISAIDDYLTVHFPNFNHKGTLSPVNMAKAWQWGVENTNLLKEKQH